VIDLKDLWAGRKVVGKLLDCSNYNKPAPPQKHNPVKDRLKNIWDQMKRP
jgi:hypothetical protein